MGKIYQLQREQFIPRPLAEVFAFFGDAGNLESITPSWLRFEIVTPRPIAMKQGARIEYRISWRFLRMSWKTDIVEWRPGECFVDVQVSGPYRLWRHTHTFESRSGGTLMRDSVQYEMPFGVFGRVAHRLRVRRDLERIFDYRAAQIAARFGGINDTVRR